MVFNWYVLGSILRAQDLTQIVLSHALGRLFTGGLGVSSGSAGCKDFAGGNALLPLQHI